MAKVMSSEVGYKKVKIYLYQIRLIWIIIFVAASGLLGSCGSANANSQLSSSTSIDSQALVANYAYSTQPGSTITAVNLANGKVSKTITTASLPSAIALSTNGHRILVANKGNDTLSVLSSTSDRVLATIPVGLEPDAISIDQGTSSVNETALVANFGDNSVTPVNLDTYKVGPAIPVGSEPVAIATAMITPNKLIALVANYASNNVTPIDLSTMTAMAPIATGVGPSSIAIGSSGTSAADLAIVANFTSNSLTPINLTMLTASKSLPLAFNPTDITAIANQNTFLITGGSSLASLSVSGFTTSSPSVSGLRFGSTITLPYVAEAVATTPNAKSAWVALQDGTVVPVTLSDGTLGKPILVGGRPSAIVIH